MSRLVALLFVIGALLMVEAPCAHALGAGDRGLTPMDHSNMDHSEMRHDEMDCAPGCDGGTGCEGCVAPPLAVMQPALAQPTVLPLAFTGSRMGPIQDRVTYQEPPPPRTRCI